MLINQLPLPLKFFTEEIYKKGTFYFFVGNITSKVVPLSCT